MQQQPIFAESINRVMPVVCGIRMKTRITFTDAFKGVEKYV
jgi:hypothetical protein